MVILDARRNDPFRMVSRMDARAPSAGLLPAEPAHGGWSPTRPRDGTTANDGGGEYSLFTRALVANLETPGLDIGLMLGRCGTQCARAHQQCPGSFTSLPGAEF